FLTPPGKPRPTQEQIDALNLVLTLGNDQKALAAVARGMKGLAITKAEAKAVRVPTSAVVGDQDPLKAGGDQLTAVMPGLNVVVIKGADHISTFARPDFAQAVKEFIARNSPKGAPAAAGKLAARALEAHS